MELQEAAYVSPGGKRMAFAYESVSRETELKTASFTFPEFDGAQVQSLGLGARKFPMLCIFSGEDSARKADAFEKILFERGTGTLEHPLYGKASVVPTGTVKRSDNLVSGVGESVVEVTFTEDASSEANPVSSAVSADEAEKAAEDYAERASEAAARACDVEDADGATSFRKAAAAAVAAMSAGAENLIGKERDPTRRKSLLKRLREYRNQAKSLLSRTENFVGATVRTVVRLARLPSRVSVDVLAKVQGYADMMDSVSRNVLSDPFGAGNVLNQLELTVVSMGALSAALSEGLAADALESAVTGGFRGRDFSYFDSIGAGRIRSRLEVLQACDGISAAFGRYSDFLDSCLKKQAFVDSGEGYEAALRAASAARKAVVSASFDLPSCREVTLDRDRNLLELVSELYGADGLSRLDEFINDNSLTADEMSVIPKGRAVRYYA